MPNNDYGHSYRRSMGPIPKPSDGNTLDNTTTSTASKTYVNIPSTPNEKSQDEIENSLSLAAAAAQANLNWTNITLMSTLIFGGCCANVYALEAIIKEQPSSGPLITFAQFILTALFTVPSFISLQSGWRGLYLTPRAIPLRSWVVYTAFFLTVNLLNNWAFAYKISVPLHIILRSAGPVASMIIGYLFNNRRYSPGQILAVAMLTLGVIAAALADANAKGQSIGTNHGHGNESLVNTVIGFVILALAMILSAFQGIYADRLYETYGRSHWKEALFYSHTLSLPLFMTAPGQLLGQWRVLVASPALGSLSASSANSNSALHAAFSLLAQTSLLRPLHSLLSHLPIQLAYLLMNALTQYLCIRGVHLLSAKSSSLTVTIVLNIRKLVSLLLSIYLFGNDLAAGTVAGAAVVFVGGSLFGFESARLKRGVASIKKD